ncbi:hypothetical protein K7711_09135 [Nocardia sp. CA2R105]|uniref:hypothetical protein n=1 Tax=Nocardia coffeae TaxID=2873381 RepID=UPI001CA71857|nr:hypothetical protein [Nocardia coffeae]MBY8856636.1 hypothetical protein [Nocardia coffeae]
MAALRSRNPEIKLQYLEGLIGAFIALVTEGANYLFFEHSRAGTQLALTVAILGLLLTILRRSIQSFIESSLTPVRKMSEIIDLQTNANVQEIQALMQIYISITEEEFRFVNEQIISDAEQQLRRLAVEKRSSTLQSSDYYDWIFKQFDNLKEGDWVRAASLSSEIEWNDSQLERNFLAKNIEAGARGVKIDRIFVIDPATLPKFTQLYPIQQHLAGRNPGVNGYIVNRTTLEKEDPALLRDIREGILDFNGRVGLEDIFSSGGGTRGEVTMHEPDLLRMRRVFDRLMYMAAPMPE